MRGVIRFFFPSRSSNPPATMQLTLGMGSGGVTRVPPNPPEYGSPHWVKANYVRVEQTY